MHCHPKLSLFIKKCPPKPQSAIYIYMYCSPKLQFSIKKCPLKLLNLRYIFACVVPLNYHFS